MIERNGQLELLLGLEARHDDLLVRLAELDKRVEKTLADCLALRQPTVCDLVCNVSSQELVNGG